MVLFFYIYILIVKAHKAPSGRYVILHYKGVGIALCVIHV